MFSYEKLVESLFATNAVKVCPKGKPFWYTSNKIGPYYINTHFLYGNEVKANELLSVIDKVSKDKSNCSEIILNLTLKNYHSDEIYRQVIDSMVEYVGKQIHDFDFISGGERRDWFFSLIVAHFLKKPHITIFKDQSTVVYLPKTVEKDIDSVVDLKVYHIADLITEASSYSRAWVPAIENFGAEISDSLVVIDRLQGGRERLESLGINSNALISIDIKLFEIALEKNLIDKEQFDMVNNFMNQPFESMRNFLLKNDHFLEDALKSDYKTVQRAKICIDEDLYNLKKEN